MAQHPPALFRIDRPREREEESARPVFAGSAMASLFVPGRNCCAVAPARRLALLVDGQAYFRAFARAAERAQSSILILGWDFNSNALLHMDRLVQRWAPERLGDYLNWLVRRRRGLEVRVLDWDYPMVFGADREFPPIYGLGWTPHRRVQVVYDNTHPVGGSHHQKIVVIDDALAFVGGMDLTDRRWDTSAHLPDDPRRLSGHKREYPPFHDVMVAVDGEAARVLGGIARERWFGATQHTLEPVVPREDPWPPYLKPDLADVPVAIARTLPASAERAEVREVQQLYLDMIAAARRRIYIENQYFTSAIIGEALERRLTGPDGPEVVLVLRQFSHGWLEEHTMHVLRTRLIQRLREVDLYNRFHVYCAHIDGLKEGTCIDVHSKVMIVDDEVLRVGSANLCNRSMGMDTECDVALEARGDPRIAAVIRGFRNRLLAEHLGETPERVEQELARFGLLHGAITALSGNARTLKRLVHVPDWPDTVIELAQVADPERPVSLDQLIEEFAPEEEEEGPPPFWRTAGPKLAAFALALIALAAAWRYTPLADLLDANQVTAWAREFGGRVWAPLVILAAYTPACLVMFPRPLITLAAVVAFGPVLGFVYSMSGILLASYATYAAGRRMPRNRVRRLAGRDLNAITDTLRRRGLLAVTALRLVPLAPFAVEGFVSGAIRIKLWHFMLGTFIGMLPGTLAATIFGDQLEAALEDPSNISYPLLAAVVIVLTVLSLIVRRWLVKQRRESHRHVEPAE